MSWEVNLGVSGHDSNVFYNGEKVSGIQKLEIITTAEGLTEMKMTVIDPRMKVKGTLHDAVIINGEKVKLETCPKCIEDEKTQKRIENKSW
jgi:hypothetical protein